MKHIHTTIAQILALLILASAFAFGQAAMTIKYPGYAVTIPATLQEQSSGSIVAAKLEALSTKTTESSFGLLTRDDVKQFSSVTILDILDAANGKVLRKISLDEYFGNENASWKSIPSESQSSATASVAVFEFPLNGAQWKFSKSIEISNDSALPLSKKATLSFSLQSAAAAKVKIRFSSSVEGSIVKYADAFSITSNDATNKLHPSLLFQIVSGGTAKIETTKKEKQQNLTITTGEVQLNSNKLQPALALEIIGSTTRLSKYTGKQFDNVRKYLTSHKTSPNVVMETVPDKQKTFSGDTITYTIYYPNIGTAVATGVKVDGRIPKGTTYVDGSSESQSAVVSLNRKEATLPTQGEVTSVSWSDNSKILPGEERWVRYKVLVK